MEYEVLEDQFFPGDWRVEAIGQEGEVYVTNFSGPKAEQRAREYAAWMNELQA
jgi:hypothetical protein